MGQTAMMPMAGKVNVTLAMHQDFSGLSTYKLNGLCVGYEHPAYTLLRSTAPFRCMLPQICNFEALQINVKFNAFLYFTNSVKCYTVDKMEF